MVATMRYDWSRALPLTAAALTLLVVIYRDTLMSMVGIWLESDTFSHGFLVFPAVAFLIYRARERLAAIAPRPSGLGLLMLLGCLVLWFIAHVGSVQVVEQFAFVAALCATAWAMLGWRVVLALAFPLFFSFFAVPFGDFIIPTLMQFTAWFVVEAIELSGIPVWREGFMLSIPRGDFEVAKACSGIRYLIASVSLGTFYAYLTFTDWRKRLAFAGLALLLPIVANGLRAYGIVMIAHFTNMQHAVGVDHLIYGWLFFGVLMFLMFWIGGRFADDPATGAPSGQLGPSHAATWRVGAVLAGLVISVLLAQALSKRALAAVDAPLPPATLPLNAPAGWERASGEEPDYLPDFKDADAVASAVYLREGTRVTVTIHTYTGGDRELIRQVNTFPMQMGHKILRNVPLTVDMDGQANTVGRIDMLERGPRRSVLYWYQVGARDSVSPNVAKMHEWLARLSGRPTRRALVTLSTPTDQSESVPQSLIDFLSSHGAVVRACVLEPAGALCADASESP